ncbi:hypothetical protein E1B28_009962 [Marasmius oreades]|uniref:Uncharacterized protein n=1 Tax=Marasmius oreades TaxID=181124 RepID=A0A9P7RW44_9AGAR|nr:uncharacterized protein E1B28_009962 [Marasmius oreades]KAG7090881.1 hypothetical protein E1B28_009962 [Marasmius oreades]
MARFAFIAVLVSVFAIAVFAALVARGAFVTPEAKANAVCVDHFQEQDLPTVDDAGLEALETVREVVEDAETELFNSAIQVPKVLKPMP